MPKKSSSNNDGLSIQDRWKDSGKLKPKDHPDRNRRRYRARVRVPGTGQYESETFDDAGKAKLWGQRRLAELRAGTDTAGSADLAAIAKEYVATLRTVTEEEPGVSEGYAHHIELVVAGLVAAGIRDLKAPTFPAMAHEWIAKLKPGWWAKLTDTRSPSAKRTTAITNVTRNRIVRELRTVCAYAVKTRRMLHNPALAVDSFKAAKRLRPQFELSEIKLLVSETARLAWSADRRRLDEVIKTYGGDKHAAAKELKVNIATIYNRLKSDPVAEDPWWLPACLLVYSGLRIAEAMHLRWQDIDWKGQRIRVRLQEAYSQKNDSERELPLQPELMDILNPIAKTSGFIVESEAMRESGSALRDTKREYASRDYAHGFKRYLDRIGIQRNVGSGDRVPHSLRHAWVAMMLATGESASLAAMWAGHSGDVQKLYRSQADAYHRDGARNWERGRIRLRDSVEVAGLSKTSNEKAVVS